MSRIYNLDKNVMIELLRENEQAIQFLDDLVRPEDRIAVSSIVYYEVMRGFRISNASGRARQFQALYDKILHLPLDDEAIQYAIEIYDSLHKGHTIEDADVFIAAISMANGCTLVTDNAKHFARIHGLHILGWRNIQ